MVDQDREGKDQALARAEAARATNALGPGTAGHTISGAAYRGKEIAVATGSPGPAEPGFTTNNGLGYADSEEAGWLNDYEQAEPTGPGSP